MTVRFEYSLSSVATTHSAIVEPSQRASNRSTASGSAAIRSAPTSLPSSSRAAESAIGSTSTSVAVEDASSPVIRPASVTRTADAPAPGSRLCTWDAVSASSMTSAIRLSALQDRHQFARPSRLSGISAAGWLVASSSSRRAERSRSAPSGPPASRTKNRPSG
ncbi:hypothetical protein FHX82_000283 [Amycolatopsis bartoniae]|uniref:hypothetical protein n=1 Tax=Amycolatopsis bartoniae TaxID=941986 RepID=UPI0011972077|nr:hypothetical protein [Amycolatopsis bartoniae]MBB2933263.1 hypothetical protein [Amycolatopsis bartoniae]TVS99347.1 hypothetical protein FNH07_35230 [Amycolatopsis bartoniae]